MKTTNTSPKESGFHFNWGTGIALSFVLFCSFIVYIVIRAFQLDIDLVSETYYLDELAYQDRIEEKANLLATGEVISLQQTNTEVVIQFPERFRKATGEIYFYHPSRKLFDQRYDIALTEKNLQRISKEALVKGNYKVKFSWKAEGTTYFQETSVYLK